MIQPVFSPLVEAVRKDGKVVDAKSAVLTFDDIEKKGLQLSNYQPEGDEKETNRIIRDDFRRAWLTMNQPRVELNDLSIYERYITDLAGFNTYQANDGLPAQEDRLGGWQSNAMRPIIRNKCITLAAHATARRISPKIWAYNNNNEEFHEAGEGMGILIDWYKDQSKYDYQSVTRILMAMYSPHSVGLTEIAENYTFVKDKKVDGKWVYKSVRDKDESGPKHIPIPCDQFFFPNFYEPNIQKQDFLIIRRILTYDQAEAKHRGKTNWEHVKPGVIVVMDDANKGFYQVYDIHMRQDEVEEILYWRKKGRGLTDTHVVMVNGIVIGDYDAPNPRADKLYPVDKFFYSLINERCFSGKSLVFSIQNDSRIAATLYQMTIDAGMLNLFPPTVTTGSDKAASNVIIPGLNIAFPDKDVQMNALRTSDGQSIRSMMDVLLKVEESISESSQSETQTGVDSPGNTTAYEIARMEQNASTVLGLFLTMVMEHAIAVGELMRGDILQYLTLPEVDAITGNLKYRTFFSPAEAKMRKVMLDGTMPDTMTKEQVEDMSFELLEQEKETGITIIKANPILARQLKYVQVVDADVTQPRSTDLKRAQNLEFYGAAIQNPVANQKELLKLLAETNPDTMNDSDRFITEQQLSTNPMMQTTPNNTFTNPNMQQKPGNLPSQPAVQPNV